MNVLSLFDGMSCGQIALERAGIPVEKYYSSEIDKYAISITQKNYPETIQLGNVKNWRNWAIAPDLIMGGSPCQGFSFAGKQLNFNDPRSALFFQFVECVKYFKPKYFLLENVVMKKEYQAIITELMGIEPIMINSALVSAQNRKRLYWTNIPGICQPEDRDILLNSGLAYQFPHGQTKGGVRAFVKSPTVSRQFHNNVFPICGRVVGRARVNGKRIDHKGSVAGLTTQEFEPRTDGKTGTISTVQKDNLLLTEAALEYMDREVKGGRNHWDFKHHSDIRDSKSAAVVANFFKRVPYNVLKDWDCIRKFHPIECERLQTVPDNYTKGVSNTQRYKMLGNGWTVDVIAHLFKGLYETIT